MRTLTPRRLPEVGEIDRPDRPGQQPVRLAAAERGPEDADQREARGDGEHGFFPDHAALRLVAEERVEAAAECESARRPENHAGFQRVLGPAVHGLAAADGQDRPEGVTLIAAADRHTGLSA